MFLTDLLWDACLSEVADAPGVDWAWCSMRSKRPDEGGKNWTLGGEWCPNVRRRNRHFKGSSESSGAKHQTEGHEGVQDNVAAWFVAWFAMVPFFSRLFWTHALFGRFAIVASWERMFFFLNVWVRKKKTLHFVWEKIVLVCRSQKNKIAY